MGMGVREYARHRAERGLRGNASRVSLLARRGVIKLDDDGKIDPDQADKAWAEIEKSHYAPHESKPVVIKVESNQSESESALLATGTMTLPMAAALEKEYRARLAKLDYEQRLGELVKATDVQFKWASILTQIKTKLLGIPSKLKQSDPSLSTDQVDRIDREIRQALIDLGGGNG